jgi:hypothetical protein
MIRTFSSESEVALVLVKIVLVTKAQVCGLLLLVAFGMLRPMALALSDL